MKDIIITIAIEWQIRMFASFIFLFALVALIFSQIDFKSFAVEKAYKTVWTLCAAIPIYLFADSWVCLSVLANALVEALSVREHRKYFHLVTTLSMIVIMSVLFFRTVDRFGCPDF